MAHCPYSHRCPHSPSLCDPLPSALSSLPHRRPRRSASSSTTTRASSSPPSTSTSPSTATSWWSPPLPARLRPRPDPNRACLAALQRGPSDPPVLRGLLSPGWPRRWEPLPGPASADPASHGMRLAPLFPTRPAQRPGPGGHHNCGSGFDPAQRARGASSRPHCGGGMRGIGAMGHAGRKHGVLS